MTENNEDMHADHIDALNAMAGGEEINPDRQDESPGNPLDGDAFEQADSAIDIGVTVVNTEQAKRARQAGIQGRMHKAHAEQFKRTMIPLLLVVGAMLLLISIATVMMMQSHRSENGPFMGGFGWPMAVGSFLLAAILMLGAWMFHNEIQKTQR